MLRKRYTREQAASSDDQSAVGKIENMSDLAGS